MRRNRRKPKKMPVVAGMVMRFGAIGIALFIVVVLNILASSSCQQTQKAIGENERLLARLEDERARQSMRWDEMKTTEQLEKMLFKHGLKMRYSQPDQVVRMRAGGSPYAGQIAVAKAQQRSNCNTAKISTSRNRRKRN